MNVLRKKKAASVCPQIVQSALLEPGKKAGDRVLMLSLTVPRSLIPSSIPKSINQHRSFFRKGTVFYYMAAIPAKILSEL